MFAEPRYRSWCVLALLSFSICSTVYGEDPVFDADPCVKEVNIQPDANTDEAKAFWKFPTATDANGNPAAVSCDPANGGMFSGGTTPVNCTATDTSTSVTATCSFDVNVYPTFDIGCPSNIILDTAATLDFVTPTASDSSGANPEVTCTPPTGSSFSEPETDVTCTATDTVLNDQQVSCTFVVSVGTIPVFDTPGSCADLAVINVQPDVGKNTALLILGVDWTAPESTGSTVSCEPDPNTAEFQGGETNVTCTATDDVATTLINTCEFTVLVYPTFERACPDDMIMAAAGVGTFEPPTANNDSVGVTPAVTCDLPSGSNFPEGSNEVTCTAPDSNLTTQSVSCTFTISVGPKPVFDPGSSCQAPYTVDVSPDAGKTTASSIAWAVPSAPDATVSCEPNPASAMFEGGETLVTCTAQDGTIPTLIETCNFTVRVFPAFEDNKCVGDILRRQPGGDGVSAKVAWLLPKATAKGRANVVNVSCDPESGSSFTGVETDVVCKASEGSDISTCSFKVSIFPSFIRGCPGDILLAPDSNGEKVVSWEPLTGNDDSTGVPAVVTCDYESGWTFNQTETLVTCVATDAWTSLTAECSFKVTLDSMGPTFPTGCPDDGSVSAEANSSMATHNWATPAVKDDYTATAEIKVSCIPASGSSFVFGSTTVTCVAIDSVGNTGVCDFTVDVVGDECSPACDDNSTCSLSNEGVSECICNEGYTPLGSNQCANRDECELDKPCHAEANCLDLEPPDMFSCSCEAGYFGDGVYSCSSAPTIFPDIDSENLEKIFNVEVAIADSSASSCDPKLAPESVECIVLVTTFMNQVEPFYKQVSNGSFNRIDVNQTSLRNGSVIIPHDVIYDYVKEDIRGVSAEEFYTKSIKAAVESGRIGSLAVVKNCTACQDPKDQTDVCAAAQCSEGYTLFNDKSIGRCIPTCVSVCSSNTEYCNGGSCIHEIGKSPVCMNCPSGTEGANCKPVDIEPDLALIIGLSVGLGVPALIILIGIIAYCVHSNSKKSKVTVSGDRPSMEGKDKSQAELKPESGRSNDAMQMENAGVAT